MSLEIIKLSVIHLIDVCNSLLNSKGPKKIFLIIVFTNI